MPSNYIFCNSCKQYYSSTKFTINRYRAPYKTYNSYKVNPLFYSFLITAFLTLYIGEKKEMVLITFNRPSAVHKPNYSYRCFRYCFRYYFSLYFPPFNTARINPAATTSINSAATARSNPTTTAHINPAATNYINPAATYYGPPYYGAARSWSYYHSPYGAARSQSYRR